MKKSFNDLKRQALTRAQLRSVNGGDTPNDGGVGPCIPPGGLCTLVTDHPHNQCCSGGCGGKPVWGTGICPGGGDDGGEGTW